MLGLFKGNVYKKPSCILSSGVAVVKVLKVALVSWTPKIVLAELKKAGVTVVGSRPDAVLAFGGDGTFLFAEEKHPGVPKLFVRHDRTCGKPHNLAKIVEALKNGEYDVEEFPKLEAAVGNRRLVGMNDINIHYVPPCALRFAVKAGGRTLVDNAIGDGLVVATPYGSTGYYRSITRSTFSHGIGLAFNNCTQPMKSPVVSEDSAIAVGIIRGPGVLAADCNRRTIRLKDKDIIKIRRAAQPARLIRLKGWPLKIEKLS
jgi:NAD kinase